MTTLLATQHRMHALLLGSDVGAGQVSGLFADDGRLDAATGLAVYQHGYLLRIAACMREQFPALCHALGRTLFDDFVSDYIRDCPPERHTLYDLGRRFAGWMAANRPDSGGREPWIDFMIDLARFEYAIFEMFDRKGNEGRPFADADTPDRLLRLQPGFALGTYSFPVANYYHAVRREEAPLLPSPCASLVALVRIDYLTHMVPLSQVQHCFLARMLEGQRVATALRATSLRFGLDPSEVRRSWRAAGGSRERWIQSGFFIGIDE